MTLEERKKYLLDGLQKHYEYAELLGYNVVGVFLQGSQNYNLDLYTDEYMSDIDSKAIVLPTLDDLVQGNKMVSTTYDFMGGHVDVKDIRVALEVWTKQNQSYLEMLFTDFYVLNPLYETYMKQIIDMGEDIANINPAQLLKCISGMSKEKVVALCHPYPTILPKIQKFGFDPKQLNHIIRLNHFMNRRFVLNKSFKGSLLYTGKEKDMMIEIKKGNISDEVCNYYDNNIDLSYNLLERAKVLASEYDKKTNDLKHLLIDTKYPEGEFNDEILKQLKDIINEMVKLNIILQVRGMENGNT